MIQYSLKCAQGHAFDSWFKSSDAFEALKSSGHLVCAVCGSDDVGKTLMAPRLRAGREAVPAEPPARPKVPVPSGPRMPAAAHVEDPKLRAALAELKRKVEAQSDYVGTDFAREARAMHLGETPSRSIYGETRPDEARALIEDGVPVMPLPFMPTRKTN